MAKAFEHSITIQATPESLFALTQDYSRRLQWDPFLKKALLLKGASEAGIGVRALCVAKTGLAMETEYVAYQPSQVAAVKMTAGPWFLSDFAGSWRFHSEAGGNTRVTFRYRLVAAPRCLDVVFGPMLNWVFGCDTQKRLRALKRAVEKHP